MSFWGVGGEGFGGSLNTQDLFHFLFVLVQLYGSERIFVATHWQNVHIYVFKKNRF